MLITVETARVLDSRIETRKKTIQTKPKIIDSEHSRDSKSILFSNVLRLERVLNSGGGYLWFYLVGWCLLSCQFFPVPASSTCKYLLLLCYSVARRAPRPLDRKMAEKACLCPLPGQLPLSLAGALSNMSWPKTNNGLSWAAWDSILCYIGCVKM